MVNTLEKLGEEKVGGPFKRPSGVDGLMYLRRARGWMGDCQSRALLRRLEQAVGRKACVRRSSSLFRVM